MVTVTSGIERYATDVADKNAREDASAESAREDNSAENAPPADAAPAARIAKIHLPYEPFPKQNEFHKSPAKYRLFGGAAGPGKSKALLMEAILQAHDHPGANTLLLRRTFPELEQTLLLYFRRDVPHELYKTFQESKHLVTWQNGSTTRFGYCQSEHDVYQYQGAEFLFIGIDELTMFTLRQWQFLTSRNRCPVPGAFPCMAAATNPGNIGHAWVKSLWIDKQPAPGMENPAEYDPADYDFIPARVTDNPIYAGDEHYLKTLRALPSHLRRAFLDGDWDVFAGQYFDRFDYSRHVLRAEEINWQPWWPRWISMDWGFEHPSAVYWHASVPSGDGFVGAQQEGLPGRRNDRAPEASARGAREIIEPGRSGAPGADACRDDVHLPGSGAEVVCSAGILPANLTFPATVEGQGFSPATKDRREAPSFLPEALPPSRPQERTTGFGPDLSNAPSGKRDPSGAMRPRDDNANRIVTYREYVTRRTPPRELAREIIARSIGSDASGASAREKIDAIYLSPDAFARRTDEASIADQMGDVFAAAGFPRPVPADDDRVGGWMLMYQMLDSNEWVLTDNCIELLRTLPNLVRDPARVEDVEKMDGDDPADAARYGLKSRYGAHLSRGSSDRRMPLADRLAARVVSADPTIRAMQARLAMVEERERGATKGVPFAHHRRRFRDNP